jgi:hypothetical protein
LFHPDEGSTPNQRYAQQNKRRFTALWMVVNTSLLHDSIHGTTNGRGVMSVAVNHRHESISSKGAPSPFLSWAHREQETMFLGSNPLTLGKPLTKVAPTMPLSLVAGPVVRLLLDTLPWKESEFC